MLVGNEEMSRTDFVLSAPVATRCAQTQVQDDDLSFGDLFQPEFILGAPFNLPPVDCEEEADEWELLTTPSSANLNSGKRMGTSTHISCRDWMKNKNSSVVASKEEVAVRRLWRHVQKHKRLPKERNSKKVSGSIAAVVTRSSPLIEVTLRPGFVLYHSSTGSRSSHAAPWCSNHWSGRLAQSLLPEADLYGTDRKGFDPLAHPRATQPSCSMVWDHQMPESMSDLQLWGEPADRSEIQDAAAREVLFLHEDQLLPSK